MDITSAFHHFRCISMPLPFRCYYCETDFEELRQYLDHCINLHQSLELKYRKLILNETTGRFAYQSVHHPTLIPEKILQEGRQLKVVGDTVYIGKGLAKRQKIASEVQKNTRTKKEEFVLSVTEILPALYDILYEEDQTDIIERFLHLVSTGEFPLQNIAYILFLDVVNWYSKKTTTLMRYQTAALNFWKVGYRLFHGKFLRFISGQKSMGHSIDHPEDLGYIDPSSSSINFAVPSRCNLYRGDEQTQSNSFLPGIFHQAIDAISKTSENKIIKLAVDGKKISRGKGVVMGDIDC